VRIDSWSHMELARRKADAHATGHPTEWLGSVSLGRFGGDDLHGRPCAARSDGTTYETCEHKGWVVAKTAPAAWKTVSFHPEVHFLGHRLSQLGCSQHWPVREATSTSEFFPGKGLSEPDPNTNPETE